MPRAQNAHAYVNAAFLIQFTETDVVKNARIVYGGINPDFIHASNTEQYLVNKHLYDETTLRNVLEMLNSEIKPNETIEEVSPKYRKDLALALFYKVGYQCREYL